MKSRKQNITIEEYVQKEGRKTVHEALSKIKVEGEFILSDTELLRTEENTVNYRIKGYANWGVTFPRTMIAEADRRGVIYGYFHQHEDERVYLRAYSAPHKSNSTMIACLECGVGIVGSHDHSKK